MKQRFLVFLHLFFENRRNPVVIFPLFCIKFIFRIHRITDVYERICCGNLLFHFIHPVNGRCLLFGRRCLFYLFCDFPDLLFHFLKIDSFVRKFAECFLSLHMTFPSSLKIDSVYHIHTGKKRRGVRHFPVVSPPFSVCLFCFCALTRSS